MTRKLTLALCGVALTLAGGACGEKEGGSPESLNALTAAAEKATDAGSSAMRMDMTMSVDGQDLSMQGEGKFDYDEQLGEMTMTISGSGLPSSQSIDMIVDDRYLYMKTPAALGGGGWQRMDMTVAVGSRGANQFGQDPTQYLDFLRGAGEDIEEVGTEEIDGVTTTHYKAELSFEAILDHAAESGEATDEEIEALRTQLEALGDESMPSEVWIDDDGLPRRMKLAMSVEAGGQSADMDITIDLFDYGIEVDVEPPKEYEEITAPAG